MRTNMHTHSTYCDGKDRPEEMVKEAIHQGFDILGFSGHGYSPFDECSMSPEATKEYIRKVTSLKEKYREQITLYLGIEEDSTMRIPSKEPYDFVIASVHFLEKDGTVLGIDYSREMFEEMLRDWYGGSFLRMAEAYYQEVSKSVSYEEADIIGHLDLLMKYNDDERYIRFDDPDYLAIAKHCIDILGDSRIYEVNTGAIARGYRTLPYPDRNLLEYMKLKNLRVMLNSDCHDRTKLACGYELSLKLLKDIGFTELWMLKDGQYLPAEISLFH